MCKKAHGNSLTCKNVQTKRVMFKSHTSFSNMLGKTKRIQVWWNVSWNSGRNLAWHCQSPKSDDSKEFIWSDEYFKIIPTIGIHQTIENCSGSNQLLLSWFTRVFCIHLTCKFPPNCIENEISKLPTIPFSVGAKIKLLGPKLNMQIENDTVDPRVFPFLNMAIQSLHVFRFKICICNYSNILCNIHADSLVA